MLEDKIRKWRNRFLIAGGLTLATIASAFGQNYDINFKVRELKHGTGQPYTKTIKMILEK